MKSWFSFLSKRMTWRYYNVSTRWRKWHAERWRGRQIRKYVNGGRKPWSEGYQQFKQDHISAVLNSEKLMTAFSRGFELPQQYGQYLDERVVEYPWLFSRLSKDAGDLLDAGSSLNFDFILTHPVLKEKTITIVTLEPEPKCFWRRRISYFFGDIRSLAFRDNYFDDVVCISTLEHVGMDNTMVYSADRRFKEGRRLDFLKAVAELRRVVKRGGRLFVTVPYGRYTDFGWYQQFDREMVRLTIDTFGAELHTETYYCYESGGWSVSDKYQCEEAEGFDIHRTKYFVPSSRKDYDADYAAGSRAIAALELQK